MNLQTRSGRQTVGVDYLITCVDCTDCKRRDIIYEENYINGKKRVWQDNASSGTER